jgi:serine/threonine protein kinase
VKGKILGSRYQVLEYIAEGGFGKTYLAQDTQLPEKDLCIVKQLAPSFNDPKLLAVARRLFKTEAAALYRLGDHPQIPKLLAYFEEDEKFYLVQQYIAGQTLDKEITPTQIWSTERVIELLKDCLNILCFIHERGVIHRDLKPANLIRRNSDRKIVLVDFGSVKNILQGQNSIVELTV